MGGPYSEAEYEDLIYNETYIKPIYIYLIYNETVLEGGMVYAGQRPNS